MTAASAAVWAGRETRDGARVRRRRRDDAFDATPGTGVRTAVAAATTRRSRTPASRRGTWKVFMGNAAAGVGHAPGDDPGAGRVPHDGLAGTPLVNVENACASGGTALQLGWDTIAPGSADVALVVGAEQLSHEDKARTFAALRGSTDIDEIGEPQRGPGRRIDADGLLRRGGRAVPRRPRRPPADLARVAVKNRHNGDAEPARAVPHAADRRAGARQPEIADPLTLPMCAPVTDGAAALVLCSAGLRRPPERRRRGSRSRRRARAPPGPELAGRRRPRGGLRAAGLGPDDLDLVELHDAAAPAELLQYAEIGLCEEGEGHHLLRRGETELGGRMPVNISGGLLSRGHPLGATGCAQVVELCTQLRGRAGARQVEDPRVGMAINCGGWLGGAYASRSPRSCEGGVAVADEAVDANVVLETLSTSAPPTAWRW